MQLKQQTLLLAVSASSPVRELAIRELSSYPSNDRECYLLQAFLNESFCGGTSTVLPYIHQCAVL